MNIYDILFILILIILLIFAIYLLKIVKREEKNMSELEKSKKNMIDLDIITSNIERDYKPLNIELTSYEQEQEDNAIISYEELISNKNDNKHEYASVDEDIDGVKKVDFSKTIDLESTQRIELKLMSYEKEEAFLKALKQLKNDLVS